MVRKVKIIAVGKVKEKHFKLGCEEFTKRLKPFCNLDIVEIKDQGMAKEALKIKPLMTPNTFLLDPTGTHYTSEGFAELIKQTESEIGFVIGGPEGIDPELKKKCKLISLSKMTFLHEMTRMILVEQVYRSFMILNNRKYHK